MQGDNFSTSLDGGADNVVGLGEGLPGRKFPVYLVQVLVADDEHTIHVPVQFQNSLYRLVVT